MFLVIVIVGSVPKLFRADVML